MKFKDIEAKLEHFFARVYVPKNEARKAVLKEAILAKFSAEKPRKYEQFLLSLNLFFENLVRPKYSGFGFGVISIVAVFILAPMIGNTSNAGSIEPKFGLVEIVRNGERQIVTESTILKVGDIIEIGSTAEADIYLSDKLVSTAKQKTELRVVERDELFLKKGSLENQNKNSAEISLERGRITPEDGARFQIAVSETGEATILAAEKTISIQDWLDGQKTLAAGEEVRLTTDTKLEDITLPDLNLSRKQIQAIASKLDIARTKAFKAAEKNIAHRNSGKNEFDSAERTFRSIINVLNSTRSLELIQRVNPDLIANETVHAAVTVKTKHKPLLENVKATEALLAAVKSQSQNIWDFTPTGQLEFDRFQLITKLFNGAPESVQSSAEVLQDQYLYTVVRTIISQELKIDQISALNDYVKTLPVTTEANEFLAELQTKLEPFLADVLEEKRNRVFSTL